MLTPANKTDLATAIENRNPYSSLSERKCYGESVVDH
jgi:hypothetical protein